MKVAEFALAAATETEAVSRDPGVGSIENGSQEGEIVDPCERSQESAAREEPSDGFRPGEHPPVGLDELHGPLALLGGDPGVAFEHPCIPKRVPVDPGSDPPFEPAGLRDAKGATTVVEDCRTVFHVATLAESREGMKGPCFGGRVS